MHNIVIPLLIVFTVANALAPTVADGGSRFKFLFNLGITAAITGIGIYALPKVAAAMFSVIKL